MDDESPPSLSTRLIYQNDFDSHVDVLRRLLLRLMTLTCKSATIVKHLSSDTPTPRHYASAQNVNLLLTESNSFTTYWRAGYSLKTPGRSGTIHAISLGGR